MSENDKKEQKKHGCREVYWKTIEGHFLIVQYKQQKKNIKTLKRSNNVIIIKLDMLDVKTHCKQNPYYIYHIKVL